MKLASSLAAAAFLTLKSTPALKGNGRDTYTAAEQTGEPECGLV